MTYPTPVLHILPTHLARKMSTLAEKVRKLKWFILQISRTETAPLFKIAAQPPIDLSSIVFEDEEDDPSPARIFSCATLARDVIDISAVVFDDEKAESHNVTSSSSSISSRSCSSSPLRRSPTSLFSVFSSLDFASSSIVSPRSLWIGARTFGSPL